MIKSLHLVLLIVLVLEAGAVNSNDEPKRMLEDQTSTSNTNSSLQVPSNQTTSEDPPADPCQNLTSIDGDHLRSISNVFTEFNINQLEYRYLECESEDSPCSSRSACCECQLVCKEGFSNCTTILSPPTNPPISENLGGNNKYPGMIDPESVSIPKASFTSSTKMDWIAAFASIIILLSCCINALFIFGKLRKRGLDHSRSPIVIDTDDALTLPPADGGKDLAYVAKVKRHEDIICKFHFRTIPYKAVDGGSSRSFGSGGDDSGTDGGYSVGDLECPTSPGSVQRRLQKQKRRRPSKLSFLRRQARKDECCICLENYGQGDTICVPLSSSCSHMFHEECVVAWLQHNNRCPMCRFDIMKEIKVVDEPVLPSLDNSSDDASAVPAAPIPTEITQTEEQMEDPHSSESDEESNAQDVEDDSPQPIEEQV